VHRKGLSPVWVLMWICSAEDEEKFLLHTLHKCLGEPSKAEVNKIVLVYFVVYTVNLGSGIG